MILVVRYPDFGKSATYTAEELVDVNDLTIGPAKDEDICLTSEEKNNKINLAVTGAEATDRPTVKADKQVVVQLDADGNKIADEDEFSATPENVKAMNQNTEEGAPKKVTDKEKSATTVTDKVKPGATVKITSADGKTDLTPADGVKVDQDGNFTAEITKQEVGTEIKVTATEGGEKESQPATAKVVERQQLPEPTINPIKTGENTVADKAEKATIVDICKKVGNSYELIKECVKHILLNQ